MSEFTHFDLEGNAIMVDVGGKHSTDREAVACGSIFMTKECYQKVTAGIIKKGDVCGVARVAGIIGTKKTAELIPLCHPISLTKVKIDFEFSDEQNKITAFCTAKATGVTGVEMEALTGVSTTLLTIYDMCKAVDKSMVLSDIHLCKKTGGKSGEFYFKNRKEEKR